MTTYSAQTSKTPSSVDVSYRGMSCPYTVHGAHILVSIWTADVTGHWTWTKTTLVAGAQGTQFPSAVVTMSCMHLAKVKASMVYAVGATTLAKYWSQVVRCS